MNILVFNADDNDVVGAGILRNVENCGYRYVNPRLTSLASTNNLIQRISNGDITQFIVTLGYQYTLVFDTTKPIGRSLSFFEIQQKL